jgi:hypothetical protein
MLVRTENLTAAGTLESSCPAGTFGADIRAIAATAKSEPETDSDGTEVMGVTTSSLSSIEFGAERAYPQGFAVARVGLAATFSPGTEPAELEFAA